jgi:hypothetical protein
MINDFICEKEDCTYYSGDFCVLNDNIYLECQQNDYCSYEKIKTKG